ncbi:MAG: HAMP domain-containing sensor histidine kinase [Dehalococcoidales bacterium]
MSLRMRLVLSFTLVVVLSLTIAAVAVTVVLQSSRDRLSMERLNDIARPIFVQVQALARGEEAWNQVVVHLREQAQNNSVYIFLTDADDKVIIQVPPRPNIPKQTEEIPLGEYPDGVHSQQGTFNNLEGHRFLYSAYSISRLFDYQRQNRFANIVLAVPQGETTAILAPLAGLFLRVGLVVLVISIIIALFLARSAYRPMRLIAEAVDKIAQGEYDHEIPVSGPREIRNLAKQFNEMVTKVKESQQQLRHFVADVSHQLRTPLTSIQGFAQAILDGTADNEESRQKAAQVIEDESKRMIRQVEELLELSRMQSGQLQMAGELVDVKELLYHCLEVFSLRAEEKEITVRTGIEPLMPVRGDVDRLEQVFSNLLDNAIKNTPARGEVTIDAHNNNQGLVHVTIADTGPGIPPEQLLYIFERYYQASGLRSGYGLGLAIAKEIVTGHGGKIEAESNPGEGTRFIVTLPSSVSTSSG